MSIQIDSILIEDKDINTISFDIFDTLLFRMVKRPIDVFEKVGKQAIKEGFLEVEIHGEVFKDIRIEAEKRARYNKKKTLGITEISLQEIYDCMPSKIIKYPKQLMQIEVQIEKEVCFINPTMHSFIKKLKQTGKKVILTSDMYLSRSMIENILEYNDFELSLIDNIYVSCECLKSKQTGDMYPYLLEQLNIDVSQLVHIGDNYISDIMNAKHYNIKTIHYDCISSETFMNIQLEELKYGDMVPELYSLRRYAASLAEGTEEDKFWFTLGASIIGPLMSGVAEWGLDIANKNQINYIYPLMREGKLLELLLTQAMNYRKEKIHIRPMYISRKAIFLPSLSEMKDELVNHLLEIKGATIGDLFGLLQLERYSEPFKVYVHILLKDIKSIKVGEETLESKLKKYLLSNEIKAFIQHRIEQCEKYAQGYLKEIKAEEDFITIDIGFKGTIQKGIEKLFQKGEKDKSHIHLLLFGTQECVDTLFENVDIKGYVGCCGYNKDLITPIFLNPFILEQIMMCEEGTTIGYTLSEGKYIPVTKVITDIDKKQIQDIRICQKGILTYQKVYLEIKNKKNYLKEIKTNVRELTQIILRLLTLPTLEEATYIGRLKHDFNYGVDQVNQVCKEEHISLLREKGLENFCKEVSPRDVIWLEGLVTQIDPIYYINKIVDYSESHYEKSILEVVKSVVKDKTQKVVIIGAGHAGRMMYKYLKMYKIEVEAFIDNNEKLQGYVINNVRVKAITDSFESKNYVIGSFAYIEELLEQVQERFGKEALVYYYGKE